MKIISRIYYDVPMNLKIKCNYCFIKYGPYNKKRKRRREK